MSQKETRNEKLHRSFKLIEDEFIVEASPQMAKPMVAIRKHIIKKVALIAACACLCVAAIPIFFLFGKYKPIEEPPQIPVYDDAQYSALDIGNLFSGKYDAVSTSAYAEVCVPSEEYLHIGAIPNAEYLTVYKRISTEEGLNKKEFSSFTDGILSALSKEIFIPNTSYEIEEREYYDGQKSLITGFERYDDERFFWRSYQSPLYSSFSIDNGIRNTEGITLGDVKIQIDQRKSDEEIKSDFQPIKEKLCSIFNADFDDIKIIRGYSDYDKKYKIEYIYVFLYNADAHPLNDALYYSKPLSDYISIYFDNYENFSGDIVSNEILIDASIDYVKFKTDVTERYVPDKKVKMISLADAEALLYNGYVFGGHSCPLCMAMQDPVDFEEYDYVGLQYVEGIDSFTEVIPFYTFYKYIGYAHSGNKTYAKTYVPAIEVSGYEKYFESQVKYHKQSTGTEYVEVE